MTGKKSILTAALVFIIFSNTYPPCSAQTENDILLWKAVQENDIHKVDSLIPLGADLNITNEDNWTPLFVAAYYGFSEMVELLVQNGANIHAKSDNAKTPLFISVENKYYNIARKLLAAGAKADVQTEADRIYCLGWEYRTSKKDNQYQPIHVAAFCNDLEMVRLLLDHGADINAITHLGWTPLMIAAMMNFEDIMAELYLQKAELGLRNSEGYSAKDIADYYSGRNKEISFLEDPERALQEKYGRLPVLTTSLGHSEIVTSAIFNSDASLMITGSNDNTIKLWDLDLGKEIRSFAGYSYGISAISCDFKNNFLVGSDDLNTLKIWDLESGREMKTFPESEIEKISISHDNKFMITISRFRDITWWDLERKKIIKEIDNYIIHKHTQYSENNYTTYFDPDNHPYYINASDNIIRLWDLNKKKLSKEYNGHKGAVTCIAISADHQLLASGSKDQTIKIWNIESGSEIKSIEEYEGIITSVKFSSDGKFLTTATDERIIKVWDVKTGNLIQELNGGKYIESPEFINKDKYIATISNYDTLKIWEWLKGDLVYYYSLRNKLKINALVVDIDGRIHFSGTSDDRFKRWDIQGNNNIRDLPEKISDFTNITISSDFSFAISGNKEGLLHQWNLATGKLMRTYPDRISGISNLEISQDDSSFMADDGKRIHIYDINNSNIICSLEAGYSCISSFCPDNNSVIVADEDSIFVYDIASGRVLKKTGYDIWDINCITVDNNMDRIILGSSEGDLECKDFRDNDKSWVMQLEPIVKNVRSGLIFEVSTWTNGNLTINSIALSPDKRYVAAGLSDNTIRILDIQDQYNSEIKVLSGHTNEIRSAEFSENNLFLISTSLDKTIKIWETARWKEVATLISLGKDDWIVTTPEGLFDASPNAMKLIYYTQDFEIFELDQLKDRYYEPGLLQKILGFNDEPVRDVNKLDKLELYPEVKLKHNDNGVLDINLVNRGGGIGAVKIFINGKEVDADARGKGSDPDADHLNISLNLKDHPYLKSDAENIIEVKAANHEGYLVSRGAKVSYIPEAEKPPEIPRLFILASGISDYTGDAIDLKYAAKDAEDMAQALEIGAKRLFGTDKTHTWLLTTSLEKGTEQPTRKNLLRTFGDIAQTAKSTDILVIYFSGHGINWGGQDGDFYYLTKDAYTAEASAYNDPSIRKNSTISSEEMVEHIKQIPALKQVLIIDACASGKMVENLVTQRNISSSTLRALDRMKDRTGMHIITGCTADAVSYEASRYGQGILTYSLLEGIKGTALREERFVDVNQLYQYALERVPDLAKGIGGIQQPEVFSPYGTESFDIGEISPEDKENIPLARIKPVFVRSVFQDEDELEDVLGLSATIDEMLNEISHKGNGNALIFINARDFPESYKLSGLYSQDNNTITLKMKIRSKEISESFTITGSDIDDLKLKIHERINSIIF